MSNVTSPLAPYQIRVIMEKAALDTKLNHLKNFMATPTFAQMDIGNDPQAILLQQQLKSMTDYSEILGKRIDLFRQSCISPNGQ